METGNVTLLGAGCGPGLITRDGLDEIKRAEAIVYDDLIDTNLLLEANAGCEFIYVGKRFGKHSHSQDEINEILISKAREGKRVVRLKGGDSFVFGRGGEEMIALNDAGIPAKVVPGISSCIAVPERLGVPVTHRGVAQSFTVVTGHTGTDKKENYEALAGLKGTLVFLMGLHNAPDIAEELMKYGKDGDTPVSILCNGYRENEKRIRGALKDMPELVKQASTPAIFVVGEVAGYELGNTMARPLEGTSVTVTGTKYFVDKLGGMLKEQGAYVQKKPVIEILPENDAIPADFSEYEWLAFTSANGIRCFFDYIKERRVDYRAFARTKFACIGSGTAGELAKYGFIADFTPNEFTAERMGEELGQVIGADEKLLILRAANGSAALNTGLDSAGVKYNDCRIYTTGLVDDRIINQAQESTDYIVFASAMGAKAYLEKYNIHEDTKVICIGKATAEVLSRDNMLFPQTHTAESILELILEDSKNA